MINPFLFWVVALLTVPPALSLLFAKKAVHIAMSIVLVMVGLATAYVGLDAPFLGVVQIVVYTGAVMMLFVFVLMLVGVDQREDLKESIKGQRWIALFAAGGLGIFLISIIARVTLPVSSSPVSGDPDVIAGVLFSKYVLVMEVLGALLITAAIGALVMTHMPQLRPRHTQKEISASRVKVGADPVNRPMPGYYARHNALDIPALDPQGNPIPDSVSRVLEVRDQTQDGAEFRAQLEDAAGSSLPTPPASAPDSVVDTSKPDSSEGKGE
ncbi:NADH-quinone oxidoreductase subunit J [Demequina aurantiaca]|uniref:NADH-quinone oxidoreductase subunit J n=1 Tax=Demequina aurantiaca TaxID=676200 RepID=UPI0007849F48|nr:NADH-quinone oxidoreductase subunit J [Demequina aurantiaca]